MRRKTKSRITRRLFLLLAQALAYFLGEGKPQIQKNPPWPKNQRRIHLNWQKMPCNHNRMAQLHKIKGVRLRKCLF
jgi:hypothetical protein